MQDEVNSFDCDCTDVRVMFMRPMMQTSDGSVNSLRRNYGIRAEPDIDVAFYYDTSMRALKAVR